MINNKIKKFKKDIKINKDAEYNYYYGKIALKLKYLKTALSVFLLIFICGGFVLVEELSFDNIASLWRYMDIVPAGRTVTHEFRIDADELSATGYHRNNIAVLRRNRLDIYDMTGRRSNTFLLVYSNPVLRVSERYILAYDLGMNKLDIFNAVSHVHEYLGEDPIFSAGITERGFVVYVTRETGYTSVIKVLNNNFSEIYAVYRVNDFIMDADIDEGANYLVTAGYYAEGGDYLTSILLYKTDSEEPVRDIKVRGERPYRVKLNNSGFCVVLENTVRFYDLNGEEISLYNLAGRTIQLLELGRDFSAVILSERTLGNDSRILIFDKSGDIVWEQSVDREIMDIKFSDDYNYLYFLTRAGLYRIEIDAGIFEQVAARINEDGEAEYDETTRSIVFANDRNIFLSGLAKVNILEK